MKLTRVHIDMVLTDEEIDFLKWFAKERGYGGDWRDFLRHQSYINLLNDMDLHTYEMVHGKEVVK